MQSWPKSAVVQKISIWSGIVSERIIIRKEFRMESFVSKNNTSEGLQSSTCITISSKSHKIVLIFSVRSQFPYSL